MSTALRLSFAIRNSAVCTRRLLPWFTLLLWTLPPALQSQFSYVTNDGTITITAYSGAGGAVSIPETIIGLPVTRIEEFAFQGCEGLTSVTIPSSVTSLGRDAFSLCDSLTHVSIAYGVTNIEKYAFAGCPNLPSITIPDSVTSIGNLAFANCGSLTNLALGNNVASIGEGACYGCRSLTQVALPHSVVNLESAAFAYCPELTVVAIGKNVTRIGPDAFRGCPNLRAINVDPANAVYSSVDGVLFNESQTTLLQCPEGKSGSFAIHASVTYIAEGAFSCCARLTQVTVPPSVVSIGAGAFGGCTRLTSVTIPRSVTSIGDSAFRSCSSLMAVYFEGRAPSIGSIGFDDAYSLTVYHLPGTAGWHTTFGGRPTALWVLPEPVILASTASSGIGTNGFGFIISWATNIPVVVEVSAALGSSDWVPLATNTLTDGSSYFSDPQWRDYPDRFYRVCSP